MRLISVLTLTFDRSSVIAADFVASRLDGRGVPQVATGRQKELIDAAWEADRQCADLAAQWLANYPSVPKGRIVVSGAGYNTNLITIGSDSRFDGTLISRHTYRFFNNDYTTEAQFANGMVSSVGSYANRVIVTDMGNETTDTMSDNMTATDSATMDNSAMANDTMVANSSNAN